MTPEPTPFDAAERTRTVEFPVGSDACRLQSAVAADLRALYAVLNSKIDVHREALRIEKLEQGIPDRSPDSVSTGNGGASSGLAAASPAPPSCPFRVEEVRKTNKWQVVGPGYWRGEDSEGAAIETLHCITTGWNARSQAEALGSSAVERRPHTPQVAGSIPAPATSDLVERVAEAIDKAMPEVRYSVNATWNRDRYERGARAAISVLAAEPVTEEDAREACMAYLEANCDGGSASIPQMRAALADFVARRFRT